MNKRYRLGEIEEAVSEMEELIDIEDDIAEIDDDFQIVVSGWSVFVESLNLTLRQGIACVWDAEEGLFMPSFALTSFTLIEYFICYSSLSFCFNA